MRKLLVFGFFICVMFVSCSRQLTGIGTESKLQTVSVLVSHCPNKIAPTDTVSRADQQISGLCISNNGTEDNKQYTIRKNKRPAHFKLSAFPKANEVIQSVLNPSFPVSVTSGPMSKSEWRLNKVGLILIVAGIVAYFIGLIQPVAYILVGLGIIILFAPLFKKKKY
jgi:hypothetical protein